MTGLRAMTMLNSTGDTTLAWSEEADDEMEALIQKRMDAGCVFFIIDSRLGTRTKLKKATDAHKHRHLAVGDEDFAKLFGEGKVEAIKTPNVPAKIKGKAKTAKEVAKNETVGIQPRAGG